MRLVFAGALAGSVAACSLLTSFDGLSGGGPSVVVVTSHEGGEPPADSGSPIEPAIDARPPPATIFIGPGSDSANVEQRETFYATVQADGSLGEWRSGPLLPVPEARGAMATDGQSIFVLGGYSNGTTIGDVYRCRIIGDHFGEWSAEQPMPKAVARARAYARGGSLFAIGGVGVADVADVYGSSIGTLLGAWDAGTALPMPLSATAFAAGSGVYLVGGVSNGVTTDTVYVGSFGVGGAVATWNSSPNFAWPLTEGAAALTSTHLYVNGGYGGDGRRVRVAGILADATLDAWSETNPLTVPRVGHAFVYADGHVYAIGGNDGTQAVASVEVADLTAGGALTAFRSARPLPLARQFISAAVVTLAE